MNNLPPASFAGCRSVAADPLYQWDYGQILQLQDIALPSAYEVHFAASRTAATSYTVIGDAAGVAIPDALLLTGESIYAWLYLHAGEDDGETVFQVVIPVISRPEPSNGTPTPVQQDAITQAIAALNAAVAAADEAVEHYPRIADGYWQVWDPDAGAWLSTGVKAQGEDGVSPAVTVTDIAGGHRIVITDKAHPSGQYFDVMDGQDGAPGQNGADGYSPTVEVEEISGGHRITITDVNGSHTFDVMDGTGGGGAVESVNGQTGEVILTAADVGALPDDYSPPVQSVNSKTGAVTLGKSDVGLSNVDNVQQYSATNPPPYPVTSVNSKTGAVTLAASDVGALPTTGGTMSGAVAMGGYKVTGLGTPQNDGDGATKKYVDDAISGIGTVFTIKGDVAAVADLPATGNAVGDVYYVQAVSAAYVWLETTAHPAGYWEEFGEPIDFSGYIEKPSSPTANQYLNWNGSAWVAADAPVTSVNGQTGAVNLTIPSTAADVGAAPAVTEVTVSTAGAVTQALDAGKIYHFTGALTSLTITLNAAGTGVIPQYHFDFDSGSTAPTVTLPGTVTMQGGTFTPEASKHYEVDILNGYGVSMAW